MLEFDDFVQVYLAEASQYNYNPDTYAISVTDKTETWVAFLDKSTKQWYKMTKKNAKKVLTEKVLIPMFRGVLKSKTKNYDLLFLQSIVANVSKDKVAKVLINGGEWKVQMCGFS